MSGMHVTAEELLGTFQARFPREYELCALDLANRKLAARVAELEKNSAAPDEGS
jgi:hypothetical protein